jgi:hypothetical protein
LKPAKITPFKQWAGIHLNEKFMAVTPLSGYALHLLEDEDHTIYLEPGVTELGLGDALLKTLGRSRFVSPSDLDFFNMKRAIAADRAWHADFMRRYRLAERSEGKISIKPYKRDPKPGLWWNLPVEKRVVIPATDDPGIVGAAVRLALSHCETF